MARQCRFLLIFLLTFFISITYALSKQTVSKHPAAKASVTWAGLIGINYNGNHYVNNHPLNTHPVFYSGTVNGVAVSNMYFELEQLKAAGFNVVHTYNYSAYPWIELIKSAYMLGMKVIYELPITQDGNDNTITQATANLNNVITAVGEDVFRNTVILVFAGHENLSATNIAYLTKAISSTKYTLASRSMSDIGVSIPVVVGALAFPQDPQPVKNLTDQFSMNAPLAFNPYPFQWGAAPADRAANDPTLEHSVAWFYKMVRTQPFAPKPILMAETGWATEGSGTYYNYLCAKLNNCQPGLVPAVTYYQALYQFVRDPKNNSAMMAFMAHDEPAKDAAHPDNAENHYGVFTGDCELKNNSTGMFPNTNFSIKDHAGCQGFSYGNTFTVTGAPASQFPFTIDIVQTNPKTKQPANIRVVVPISDHTNQDVNPWPYFLVFDGAAVTFTGATSGAGCRAVVNVSNSGLTWGPFYCSNQAYTVKCNGRTCAIPPLF